jgi:hypothetical protein
MKLATDWTPGQVLNNANNDLRVIEQWATKWLVSFNPSKPTNSVTYALRYMSADHAEAKPP